MQVFLDQPSSSSLQTLTVGPFTIVSSTKCKHQGEIVLCQHSHFSCVERILLSDNYIFMRIDQFIFACNRSLLDNIHRNQIKLLYVL